MRARYLAVAATGLLSCLPSCGSNDPTSTKGELVLALQTDMELPKDVDKVRIRVASYGNTVFSNDYPVGPTELRIPATLAVFANPDHPSAPATIQVIGFRAGKPRVMRETVTTIPVERVATLRMPIEWLCDDSASIDNGDVTSNCPSEQTCIAGTCTAAFVDSEELPDFKPEEVFGGGNGSGNGTCFDVAQCFNGATPLTVDMATCRVTVPASDPNWNIALKLPGMGDGICSNGVCLVPLDGGQGGQWSLVGGGSDQGAAIQLPQGVCDRLQAGKIESVIATQQCPVKTAQVPPCGAWSSTGGSGTITVIDGGGGNTGIDAGATDDVGSGSTDAGATDDVGSGSTDASAQPDMNPGVDAGPTSDASTGSDAGSSGGKDGGFADVPFNDGACASDNCRQPPLCNPPPAPTDGDVCQGTISTPAANAGSPCQWDVPGRIATDDGGSGFCVSLLNLRQQDLPGMPGSSMQLFQVPEGQCGAGPGWQFLSIPNVVELCPSSCASVKGTGVGIDFIYGCPSIGAPPDGGPISTDAGPPPPPDGGTIPPDSSMDGGPALSPIVPILGGVFQVGCAPTDLACNNDELPYHAVTLSDFSIEQTEVTQSAYDLCIRASVCVAPPCSSWQPAAKGNFPVTCVSYDEASSYCTWMGRRLPTEAEWEAAARGDMGDIYPWGLTDPDCTVANFQLCAFTGPQAVRSFVAGVSRYNAFDMAGNVSEWVLDWYALYEGQPTTNPTGPSSGTMRIVKGGDFQSPGTDVRSSRRQQMESVTRNDNIGFRCAKPGF